MWEAIASNRRRSWLLIGLMGSLLVALGALIGTALAPALAAYSDPYHRTEPDPYIGGLYGAGIALLLWFFLWGLARAGGDSLLLSSVGAQPIEKRHAPQLWNIVEEMTIAAGLRQMPKVYVIEDDMPNAFAVGHRADRATVAVTSGLLRRLNRDELQGVIAHEMGHIRNLDVRFLTLAGVMMGAIVLIADVFLRSLWYGGGGRRRSSSSRGGGQAQAILMLVAVVLAILAPLLAQLLYFACSRKREYLADASGASFTRYPEGLASALEKISRQVGGAQKVNRVVAPMYIVNPLQAGAAFSLFSTHPSTEKRVQILRSMAGAGLADYEAAYRKVHGGSARCLGARTLAAAESAAARAPSAAAESKQDVVVRARAVGDLVAGLANFLLIPCDCGVRIKVPPKFTRPSVSCPRCGREHAVPTRG